MKTFHYFLLLVALIATACSNQPKPREVIDFTNDWKFSLTDSAANASTFDFEDTAWRTLNLPHDWSIESDFSEKFPAAPGGGALPGGIGWYRKTFNVPDSYKYKCVFVDFDGVYRNSEVWINGHYLGKRPYGYISFRYELTPFLKFGQKNVIAVRVDNSQQPNSRWYSGSGIYRNVWLTITEPVHVDLWGTYVTTPEITENDATINIQTSVRNESAENREVKILQILLNQEGKRIAKNETSIKIDPDTVSSISQSLSVKNPILWEIDRPYLYKMVTQLSVDGKLTDQYETPVGLRSFRFDVEKGFFLNGKHLKINGVCNHHDLGALGAAVNKRALERQLQILKDMGCNAIRTSHNPPAPELLQLTDSMGFIVMDEIFDMWVKRKTAYDYALDFPKWYKTDMTDWLKRDRNHPSVFIWSIGNEVMEQWEDTSADNMSLEEANTILNNMKVSDTGKNTLSKSALLTKHLSDIAKSVDPTRPVTAACNGTQKNNPLFLSGGLDLIGFNYHQNEFVDVPKNFPGKPFIVTESVSAVQTRGFYLMPSDSIYIWPDRWDKPFYNPLLKCSSYDNSHVPWGSTHEETWKIIKKYDFISGQFIWTGFDYLGEPTPYSWPSRSSYFGIIDLAGFPKDVYYMYQSEWTDKDVLHIFPHWNWQKGETVDVWAYYNHADEVELYLNGRSLGKRSKQGDDLHVMWRVKYEPGTLKAVSRKNGKEVLTKEISTAGNPVKIRLTPDRNIITANGKDLSFVTVELVDKNDNAYPLANQLVKFSINGIGIIAGTDNGDENDSTSLKKPERHLFFGKCLAIVQSSKKPGKITLKASVEGLPDAEIIITAK
ncbi:MAG: DUF4982 domain-containing protein [Paludibacteraceae bacterium]|nr:DUF4982 domain-containing protein [Paludibacteraceae bacterium]